MIWVYLLLGWFSCFCESYEYGDCSEGDASCSQKVLAVVYSYNINFHQVMNEEEGIFQGLAEEGFFGGLNLEVHRFYMNALGENTTPEKRTKIADEISEKLKEISPDLIICCDDYSFSYIGLNTTRNLNTPIIFNGVSQDLAYLNKTTPFFHSRETPGMNVTGVFENVYVFESIRLLSVIFPSLLRNHKFLILWDNTTTVPLYYHLLTSKYQQQCKDDLNITLVVKFIRTLQDLQDEISIMKADPDFHGFGSLTWRLYDRYTSQVWLETTTIPMVVNDIKSKYPSTAFNLGQVQAGYLGGIATDTQKMGEWTGTYAGHVLNGKHKIGDLPIIDSPRAVVLNKDRFRDLQYPIDDSNVFDYATYIYETFPNEEEDSIRYVNDKSSLLYLLFLLLLLPPIPPISLVLICLVCCICCICCVTCLICCYACRLRRFKRRFRKVDVDELLVELKVRESDAFSSGKGSSKSSGGGRLTCGLNMSNLKIREELFLIPYSQLKLLKVIGKGGQSTVFLAKWKGKKVAYKNFSRLFDINIDDFQIEASILACINHPSILKFYGTCLEEVNDKPKIGIVVEFCPNGDLKDYMMNRTLLEDPLTNDEKLDLLLMISEGMEFLHEKSIIHRDLKPNNLLLDKHNIVKIIDFGLSRYSVNMDSLKTKDVGTSRYLAPEIHTGKYNHKVDVFSFGIIMWNVLTENIVPFRMIQSEDDPSHFYKDRNYSDLKVAMDPNYRPTYSLSSCSFKELWFGELMERCWDVDPEIRPEFEEIKKSIKENRKKKKNKKKTEEKELMKYRKKEDEDKIMILEDENQEQDVISSSGAYVKFE